MANINIRFNGIDYSIEESTLASAAAGFEAYLDSIKFEPTLTAGLYSSGALALYEQGNLEGAEAMLVTPWETLVSENKVKVHSTGEVVVCSDYNPDYGQEVPAHIEGDLVLPTDGSVLSIGASGFANVGISGILIPKSVTEIKGYAFNEANQLTKVVFAATNKLTTIGDNAFANCYNLTNITIPASVTNIGYGIFDYCSKLTTISFEENSKLSSITAGAFGTCRLQNFVIPSGVTRIENQAFWSTQLGSSIIIPKSVEYVGKEAFHGDSINSGFTIYCEAESQPSEWHENWNAYNHTIVWGYTGA